MGEREGIGSGKVYEAGFELGTPKAQQVSGDQTNKLMNMKKSSLKSENSSFH